MKFENLGIPVRDAGLFSYTVGPGASGRHDTVYITFFQRQAPWFVVGVNVETGNVTHFQGGNDSGCWAITLGPDGCIYTGTCPNDGRINRIDPSTGAVTDLGPAVAKETYVWDLVTGADGCIYGGTFPRAKLFRLDPETGEVRDLGRLDAEEQYNRHLVAKDDWIYCAVGTVKPRIVAYNVHDQKRCDIHLPGLDISGIPQFVQAAGGELYCSLSADRYDGERVYAYRLSGLVAEPVSQLPEPVRPRLGDGREVVSVSDREIVLEDENGKEHVVPYSYEGAGALLFVLRNGPANTIYGSTALPLRLFSLDPNTGQTENLGNPTQTGGEIYSMVPWKRRLLTCAYPRADLTVYEPKALKGEPQSLESESGGSERGIARHLGFVGDGQDRAPAMIVGDDGFLYIGTVPTYGETGGAIVRFDPREETWTVYRHVVPDQSVVALEFDPERELLYAGTSVSGGGGSRSTADAAVLAAWDCRTREIAQTWRPFDDVRSITALARVGRKLIGLTADGRIFRFDLDEREVVKRAQPQLGGAHMEALVPLDGEGNGTEHLVALLGNHVVRIDADSLHAEVLGTYPSISAGFALHDGYVYFASGAEVIRGRLPSA